MKNCPTPCALDKCVCSVALLGLSPKDGFAFWCLFPPIRPAAYANPWSAVISGGKEQTAA